MTDFILTGNQLSPGIDYRQLPSELTELDCWRVYERQGLFSEILPPTPDVVSEQFEQLQGLATFDVAMQRPRQHGYHVPYIHFTGLHGIVGVLLRGCRDLDTGEIEGWAKPIIESYDTYTEITPNGFGIQLLGGAANLETGEVKDMLQVEALHADHLKLIDIKLGGSYLPISGRVLREGLSDIGGYVSALACKISESTDKI